MLPVLICLQAIQVAILWLHDWAQIGPLTDVAAIRARDTPRRIVTTTLIQSVPFTVGLIASLFYLRTGRPAWVWELAMGELWSAICRGAAGMVVALSGPS